MTNLIFGLMNKAWTPYKRLRSITGMLVLMIAAVWLVYRCEDRFTPDLGDNYTNNLVVEGRITNMPGPYTIKLSSSTVPDNLGYAPLPGYQVMVSDNEGNTAMFPEIKTGVYQSDSGGFQGVVGRKYKIDITATNGKTYTSSWETLNPPVGIDTVYARLEYKPTDEFPTDLAGYQFYIDTKPAYNDSTYLMWDLKATYQYQSDFVIRFIYDGELRTWTDFDSLRTCWRTKDILEVFVYGTDILKESRLRVFALHYVPVTLRDLSIRYSLLTTQLTISREAYTYWSSVKDQHSGQDELYTRQPYQLKGNVFNPQDPQEVVLGYFMAAGEVRNRIFVNRPDPPVKMRYLECKLVEADYMNFGTIFLTQPWEWPQFATIDNDGRWAYPVNQECLDCRLRGGTILKPEFWIDL